MNPWLAFLLGITAASIGWAVEIRRNRSVKQFEKRFYGLDGPEDGGIHLPGWHCRSCRAFNGSARELLTRCRVCQAQR